MVAGLGAMGVETAYILLQMGLEVQITNRSPRVPDKKISGGRLVPWTDWKESAKGCGAVFLCTSAEEPILSSADMDEMPDVWVLDLGSPHQSGLRGSGVRITLDDMNAIASEAMEDYNKLLGTLENEADKTSGALLAEISILTDDTWKQIALSRAHSLISERASLYAKKIGVGESDLEVFASSVVKAFLHPLVAAQTAHSSRAWRILSGEDEEYAED
jgi:glutamyl-tRNA reductase